ncbi:hypothetical protein H257_04413 [Aphanomyces astaci]|uniref:Histidine acid phosphatase n=2 Tax=Aphanomyces astaci TaxID=112090 RepID=W4GVP7_APHAT|nr:hypothetical protein H257_04413 [Aphanomyces astaci]ETV83795.1 hypothetical protein H257_04413 [Aphanomyces astaci]RQM22042.1 hypothetical protein B5M09_009131 [Aphanomyces astaci]|eukprot:XP_009827225.1 hypothetical protein H257_04413 [Aphanomyces astaci]
MAPPAAEPSDSLRAVIALSTHGSRAPAQAAASLCPENAANLNAYAVPFEQLTDKGMQQMVHAGAHTRDVYVQSKHFLSPTLKQKKHFDAYFRADPSHSCSQSSVTFGYGLYPDSTSTTLGFPVPVPVVMQLLSNEHDIAVTHGPCRETLDADLARFDAGEGKKLFASHASVLHQLGIACGRPFDVVQSPSDDLSVIADMLRSDSSQGLRSIVPPNVADDVQGLEFNQMLGRYLGSPRQVTYYLGGFPDLMLSQLNKAAENVSPANDASQYKLYAYTGHRQLLHGMGLLVGWNFHFDGQPQSTKFNTSALPAGATLYFELHAPSDSSPVVETHIWSPQTNRTRVKLTKCSSISCPLSEFTDIIDRHIQHTTPWQELCQYHPVNQDSSIDGTMSEPQSNHLVILGTVLVALTLFAMHSAYTRINQFRRQSQYRQL